MHACMCVCLNVCMYLCIIVPSSHMYCKTDIRVRLRTARIYLLPSDNCQAVHIPLLVFGCIIYRVLRIKPRLIRDIHLKPIESPGNEDDITFLSVKWKMAHIQRAVCFDDGRKHPKNVASMLDNCKGVHKILEAIISTEKKSIYIMFSFSNYFIFVT